MEITPKYSFKNKYFQLDKPFTNRESQRNYFHKRVNKLLETENNEVIVYHGVGGIGKSELLKQLKKEVKEQDDKILISEIDFQNPQLNNPSSALLEIKRNFTNKNLLFPHFDLAYYILFKKRNPLYKFDDKNLPFSEEASIIGGIIGAFDGLGFTGSLVNLVNFVYKQMKKLKLDSKMKEHLEELADLKVHEIEERLPAFFSYDISKIREKKSYKSFICFLDTYEYIYRSSSTIDNKLSKDLWLRELLANLTSTLFVICSREKIFWEKENVNWNKYIRYSQIDCFSDYDAEKYLISCKIVEKDIRKKIILATSGHPFYIDLCIDTYYQLKNQKQVIAFEKFASSKKEVFQRFKKRLCREELEVFKILSLARFYNEELFIYLLKSFPTGYPITAFPDLNRFSFIRKRKGKYLLHDLVKESFNSITSISVKKSVNISLSNFYESKLQKYLGIELYDSIETSFEETVYHAVKAYEKEGLSKWLKSYDSIFEKLQFFGSTQKLVEVFNFILKKIPVKSLSPKLFSIYADMIHLGGSFKTAVDLIERYIRINLNQIDSNLLLHLKIRVLHHKMFYTNVTRLKKQSKELIEGINQKEQPDRYNELLFMIGGNLGLLCGDIEESKDYLVKSIKYANLHNFYDFKCRSIRKYVDILRLNGHMSFGIKWCKAGIDLAEKHNYNRYKIYLLCTLADIYRSKKDISKSLDYYEMVKTESVKRGIVSWKAHAALGKSLCYYILGNIDDSKGNVLSSFKTYEDLNLKWGIINSKIVMSLLKLIDHEELIITKKMAQRLGYKYETNVINQIISNTFELSKYQILYL